MVGLGGFVGAIARYGISGWIHRLTGPAFPYGTLAVNVAGCFLIGIFMTMVEVRQVFSPNLRLILMTGFLGSLTTFSTFGYETVALFRDGELGLGLGNMAANMLLGLFFVYLGSVVVKSVG